MALGNFATGSLVNGKHSRLRASERVERARSICEKVHTFIVLVQIHLRLGVLRAGGLTTPISPQLLKKTEVVPVPAPEIKTDRLRPIVRGAV